ncbi:MAG: CaiB/BaiF CoA transferase family protein [Egibacteraceae bacterium]
MTGPLEGVRVLEVASIGPGPFAAMLLADMGADVVRVDRVRPAPHAAIRSAEAGHDVLARGRRSVAVDLKDRRGAEVVRRLVEGRDVLIEGFRPGVAERLGLGPEECLQRNPRLVYGRMTGWGQDGPWAKMAGHDINYIAVAGALYPIGPADRPPPVPLNYVGDFGGGGMLLAFGVCAALLERERSGRGQVIDAAMVDGAALQTAMFHGLLSMGGWTEAREENLLDGAAPFYRTYQTADGGFIAVGALEPSFYTEMLARLGLDPTDWPQHDRTRWPALTQQLTGVFAGRTRDDWARIFSGSDACVAPVLSLTEAPRHEQLTARRAFVEIDGVVQPSPAPRFSRTIPSLPRSPALAGADTDAVLAEAGLSGEEIADLRRAGVIASKPLRERPEVSG